MYMGRLFYQGLVFSLLLFLLTGFCVGDEQNPVVVYIQGKGSTVTEETNGTYVITIKDTIPYIHFEDNNKSSLEPIQALNLLPEPLNAAFVRSGDGTDKTSMMKVSNLTLSEDNKVLKLTIEPLEFYDGKVLKSFQDGSDEWDSNITEDANIGIYLELPAYVPVNNFCDCPIGCTDVYFPGVGPACECTRNCVGSYCFVECGAF